jgi:hypothetical protein
MIQRIQSLYLLLATGSLGTLFMRSVAFADFTEPNPSLSASADGYLNIYDSPISMGMTVVGIALSLLTIFLFKNRPLQVQLTWLGILTMAALLGFAFWQIQTVGAMVALRMTGVGFIPLSLSVVFSFLAIRSIRKDEKLVRSADRLR